MNSRGMEIKGTIDGKVSFYTLVTDNQMSMPRYINEKIVLNQFTMPGETWLNVGSSVGTLTHSVGDF